MMDWTSNNVGLDDLDNEILKCLMRDSRVPYLDIASRMNVTSATIKNRVEKLKNLGAIKSFSITVDPRICFGYNISALLNIKLSSSKNISEIYKELDKINGVFKTFITTGSPSQITAQIFAKDLPDYSRLMSQISAVDTITDISSLMILNEIHVTPQDGA